MNIKEFFNGCHAGDGLENIKIRLINDLSYVVSKNRFPMTLKGGGNLQTDIFNQLEDRIEWENLGLVTRNGGGATGFDLFSIRNLEEEITINGEIYKYAFIVTQARHTDNDLKLTSNEIYEAYQESKAQIILAIDQLKDYVQMFPQSHRAKHLELLNQSILIFACISNRPFDMDIDVPEGCLVIGRNNISNYLGCLSDFILCLE